MFPSREVKILRLTLRDVFVPLRVLLALEAKWSLRQ